METCQESKTGNQKTQGVCAKHTPKRQENKHSDVFKGFRSNPSHCCSRGCSLSDLDIQYHTQVCVGIFKRKKGGQTRRSSGLAQKAAPAAELGLYYLCCLLIYLIHGKWALSYIWFEYSTNLSALLVKL